MKYYQATIYQLQDALNIAEKHSHVELILAIQSTINMLQSRIEFGDDAEVLELS
jgi:hypothetical protein